MPKSLIAPLAGAAIGGTSGGKKEKSTQQAKPLFLTPGSEKALNEGNEALLAGALDLHKKPFTPAPMGRVASPVGAYDTLFSNPEMLQIQQGEDKKYYDSLMPASQVTAAPAPENASMAGNYDMSKLAAYAAATPMKNTDSVTINKNMQDPVWMKKFSEVLKSSNGDVQGALRWMTNGGGNL
jgi:hypothetical protein